MQSHKGEFMFKIFAKACLFTALLSLLTGCTEVSSILEPSSGAKSDKGVVKENNDVQITKEHIKIAHDMQVNVTDQPTLDATITSLATQMMRNKKMKTNKPVLITSFVRLDNFKKTTEFGRIVSESLINELSNRGFNIIEYRGQMAVSINEKGEYFISRNPYKIKDKIPNTYVVVGTYSRQYGKVMLNARVMDNITGRIISSARATYVHNRRNDCILFKDCKPARTIKIIPEK
jgi:TolB-like protein